MILFSAWYVVLAKSLIDWSEHWKMGLRSGRGIWVNCLETNFCKKNFGCELLLTRLLIMIFNMLAVLSLSWWLTFIFLLTYILYISHDVNLHSAELTLGVTSLRQRFSVHIYSHTEFSWNESVSSWDRQKPLLCFSEKKINLTTPGLPLRSY